MLRNVMMKVAKSSLNNAGHWVSFNISPKLTHSYTGLYNSFLYQTFIIEKPPFTQGHHSVIFSAVLFARLFTSRYVRLVTTQP